MKSKYTPLKVFRFPEKIQSLSSDNDLITAPIHIRIKPTNACNHSCNYCAYRSEDLQLGQDMNVRDSIPQNKMEEIVEDIIDMKVKAVTFSGGGEPLLYKHIKKTTEDLANGSVKVACLTNGSLLSGEIAEVFSDKGSWLRISIDGWDNESYSSYRGCQYGMFDKVIDNLRNFKKLSGNCLLGASIILDRKNSSHVVELIEKLKDTGVDSIKVSACVVSNSGSENNKYHDDIFDETYLQINKAIDLYKSDKLEIFNSYHKSEENFYKSYTTCPYLQILPIIGADQRVYSCQDKAYNLNCGVLGSIKETRFKYFWYTNKGKFFQINPSKDCSHHCVANSKNNLLHDYLNIDDKHVDFV